jgi:hypothetical protein
VVAAVVFRSFRSRYLKTSFDEGCRSCANDTRASILIGRFSIFVNVAPTLSCDTFTELRQNAELMCDKVRVKMGRLK